MARRGAARVRRGDGRNDAPFQPGKPPERTSVDWEVAPPAQRRPAGRSRGPGARPITDGLAPRGFSTAEAARYERQLADAAAAFAADRYREAQRSLSGLVDQAPDVPAALELAGLVAYRLGNWRRATEHLERFRNLTGSTEQHPVLADSYRALGRWAKVDELWEELRDASPSAALVTEGRIVTAGAWADQGRLTDAIRLLERGWRFPKRVQDHHLRRAYALADLYERAGELPVARDRFSDLARHAPDFADAGERARDLR